MMASVKADSILSILLPHRGVRPEAVPNRLGYLLSEVRIGRQMLPVEGRLDDGIAPTIT